ncbi:DUF58 domain-containing protein [Candidatus Venteria ishoeyi]|uniref:DUF58 domain-containing protein n=1 Tax=Candidatus Venteria ishoeyi TaxID=1899563 RepID=UPI0025A557FB|nr:DUF58 domain-containing protein [Candidatus Venteria ishoeyi]
MLTVQPARLLLHLSGFCLLLAVGSLFSPVMQILWQVFGLFIIFLALLDWISLYRLPTPTLERKLAHSLPLGIWSPVKLSISTIPPLKLEIFDDYPTPAVVQDQPYQVFLPATKKLQIQYLFQPQLRGNMLFPGIHLRLYSPWRLWSQRRYQHLPQTVRIYPNFAAIRKYMKLAMENRLGQLGIRKQQRRGEGMEFHQMREYREGDSMRQIDWKTSVRQRKLISREYTDEREQQVVFLLDCSQRMRAKDDHLSHFDHCLNALLLVAYAALRQGDAPGLLTFSGATRWLPPRPGQDTINHLLNQLYDLQPSTNSGDYLQAAQSLLQRQKKRALVIILTNLRDEDNPTLLTALGLLRKKHVVLIASLREQILEATQEKPISSFQSALRYAALEEYLLRRRQAHQALNAQGALSIDVLPEQLPAALINHYLEIKRSQRL